VTVRSASRNEDNNLSDESQLSSSGKKRKNSVDKNSTARSGRKKIFKNN
jgi:hypothetical protein